MKKLMGMMLGVALISGTASYTFAQDKDKDSKKKGPAMVCTDKSKPGKDGKCKDGSDPAPAKGKGKKKS